MAVRLPLAALAVFLVLHHANGRVLDNRGSLDDLQSRAAINDLLQQVDPYENDIFYEPTPEEEFVAEGLEPSRPSPTLHLLQSFSRPRYVDASEFRTEAMTPALDINHQLTLLSASKRVQPPVEIIEPSEALQQDNFGSVYFTNPSPLYREDFPSEVVEQSPDMDYALLEGEEEEYVPEEPTYSTSVSVSTSVSYSNKSSPLVDHESPSEVNSDLSSTSISSTTETQTTDTPTTSTTIAAEAKSKVLSDSEVAEDGSSKHPGIVSVGEYPDYEVLSPLSHILAGLRGEMGPFGRDFKSDTYIRGFRPDGF